MYDLNQIKLVSKVLKNNKTNYWTGSECKKFEKEFSNYHNVKYSVAVSNGSVALEIALRALNLKKGSQIIVTPRSFIISSSCVLNLGLKPVFADVDINGNLNLEGILKVYNKSVKAIILVHLNGLPCDIDPIIKFSKKNKIYLIEDCSQAHGAKYKGKNVGSFGDVATWSFCQDKIISTGGERGMISTNSKTIWNSCWSFKDHGKDFKKVYFKKHKTGFKWLHDSLGSNYRMTEMQATLGRYQLKNLDKQIKKRNQIAKLYISGLEFSFKKGLFIQPNFKSYLCRHSFYRLNLIVNSKLINQLKLINELNKKKIQCGVGSCPEIYNEKVFKNNNFIQKKKLPMAKFLGKTSFVIPINPSKKLQKIKSEIQIIKNTIRKYI